MLYLYFIKQITQVMKATTLGLASAFDLCIGDAFMMDKKFYVYVGQTFEKREGFSETIVIAREDGTTNYKALNLSKYEKKQIIILS